MAKKDIRGKDGAKIEGFIEFEKINRQNHLREIYHNTITPGGKQFILSQSMGRFLGMGANQYGDIRSIQALSVSNRFSNDLGSQCRDDTVATNVLLNLNDNVLNGLGANTDFINVWNEDFTDTDKVVGFANNNIQPYDIKREGKIDYCKPQFMTDPNVIAKRWYYPAGVATGEFNCIAMMPASILKYAPGYGVRYSRMLDMVNPQETNYVGRTTQLLPPGIPGITGQSEILLNFDQNGVSKHKYDFATGEMKDLSDTDPWLVYDTITNRVTDLYLDTETNILYAVYFGTGSTTNVYISSRKINGDGTYEVLNNGQQFSNSNAVSAKMFKWNGSLWLSVLHNYKANTTSRTVLVKLNKSSTGAVTGGTNYTDYSQLGITIPSIWNVLDVMIGEYNGNYILYTWCNIKDTIQGTFSSSADRLLTGFVFNDMVNFASSITDMVPNLTPFSIPFKAGTYAGFLENGVRMNYSGFNWVDTSDVYRNIQNNSRRTGNALYNTGLNDTNGLWLTLDKQWCNVLSFAKLTAPITKTDTDELYVTYGYKIV